MKWMIPLVLLLVSVCAMADKPFDHEAYGHASARSLRSEFRRGGIRALAYRGDEALDHLVDRAIEELVKKGDWGYAENAKWQWQSKYSGTLSRSFGERGIDDRRALFVWLASFYNHVQSVLGVDLCKSLHLSDIKTLNDTVRVVFAPCTFDLLGEPDRQDEYKNNFCKDKEGDNLYGFAPVVTYWATDIGCIAATHGTGVMMVCGLAAGVAEMAMAKWFAGPLSDFIFTHSCS